MTHRLIEGFKLAFLIFGILASGFGVGFVSANSRHSCAPPWIIAEIGN